MLVVVFVYKKGTNDRTPTMITLTSGSVKHEERRQTNRQTHNRSLLILGGVIIKADTKYHP